MTKAHRAGQMVFRHHLFDIFHDEVHQRSLYRPELVAEARQDNVLHRRFRHHLLQRMREVRDDNDGAGAAVVELVLELARRIERINVDHHHAGAQHAEQRHRILQQIRHHQRDAIAFFQAQPGLQVSGERAALLFQLPIAQRLSHIDKGGLIGVALCSLFN